MADDGQKSNFRRSGKLLVITGAAAVAVLLAVVYGLLGPPRPRQVTYLGGWERTDASCQGPVLWTGKRAYAACNWVYRKRALVAFDPERAEAETLHRWEIEDGNTPDLRIVQPCGDGELFVIAETKQTTVVTRRGTEVKARVAPVPDKHVLGAACDGETIELFVATGEDGYGLMASTGDGFGPVKAVPHDAAAGRLVAAWRQAGSWHVIQHRDGEVSAGKLGEAAAVVGQSEATPCAAGQPGGWLFVAARSSCWRPDAVLSQVDGELRLQPGDGAEATAVYADGGAQLGFSEGDGPVLMTGMSSGALELGRVRGRFVVRRGDRGPVAVAKSDYSSLGIGALALPLEGDRVAIWGGIGDAVIVLGPDLSRVDGPGWLAQLASVVRFRAGTMSILDIVSFYTLLVTSPMYLIVLALAWRRRKPPEPLPVAPGLAWAFLLAVIVGARGVYHIVPWL